MRKVSTHGGARTQHYDQDAEPYGPDPSLPAYKSQNAYSGNSPNLNTQLDAKVKPRKGMPEGRMGEDFSNGSVNDSSLPVESFEGPASHGFDGGGPPGNKM